MDDRGLDIALLSRWYYYGINVCPTCLAGSAESDFTVGQEKDDSIRQLTLSPYSRMKADLVDLLPARLALAKYFVHALCPDSRHEFIVSRIQHLTDATCESIRLVLPNINEQALKVLVRQCITMLSQGHDIGPLIAKITAAVSVHGNMPANHPVACLLKTGGKLSEIIQAAIYGALISGLDDSSLPGMTSNDPAACDPYIRLAQLHLDLDRFSIYAHYIARRGTLEKTIVQERSRWREPEAVIDLVEGHVREIFADGKKMRMQAGYDLLLLGRNYYKAANLVIRRLRNVHATEDDYARTALELAEKAVYYLELSLLAEKYPEFEPGENVQHLNRKHRVAVPFIFGEFGVRHMLCFLYNMLVELASAGCAIKYSFEEIGNCISAHWWTIHVKFRELKFGCFQDPMPAQILIPRTVAFASICMQPGTKQYMQNIIQRNSGDLYTRYLTEAENLLAALSHAQDR